MRQGWLRRYDTKNPQKHGPYYQLSFTWAGQGPRVATCAPSAWPKCGRTVANSERFRELTDESVDLMVELEQQEREQERCRTVEVDPHDLPSEVDLLQQIVLQLLQAVEDKDQLLARVQHQLAQLLRYRYGQKRERIDENQLFLFAAQIIAASQRASTASSSEEPAADSSSRADGEEKKEKPERRGHGRKALPESLERRRVVFDLEESQRQCGQCQTPMHKIGEDVSERLEFIPASLQVIEEVRPKYACAKGCGVVAAQKPAAPIEKGLPGPGLLAHVAISKYGDHLPLNRMESIFQRHGVELSRKTMCDWMAACAELVQSGVGAHEGSGADFEGRTDRRYASASAGSRANPHAHRPDLDVCGGSQPSLHRLRLHGQS